MGDYIYRSYNDLWNDIGRWSATLPPLSAVAGVPRSGLIPAAMLAMQRHIPCLPLDVVLAGGTESMRPSCSRQLVKQEGPILVLDDTCWQGRTAAEVRSKMPAGVLYGAVYCSEKGRSAVDVAGYHLPTAKHTFAWNLMRDIHTTDTFCDMDGVICEDWGQPDDGVYLAAYEAWLRNVPPKYLPTKPILGVVTARLDKYRAVTEEWLNRHGVQYKYLHMGPYKTTAERAAKQGFEHRKAHVFLGGREKAGLFVESEQRQAKYIAEKTGKSVIWLDGQVGFNCNTPKALF